MNPMQLLTPSNGAQYLMHCLGAGILIMMASAGLVCVLGMLVVVRYAWRKRE